MNREKRYLQHNEIDFIKENHNRFTSKQLAEKLGCSQVTILAHCKRLRIKCTKSFFQFDKLFEAI